MITMPVSLIQLNAPTLLLPTHFADRAIHANRPICALEWHSSVLPDGNLVNPPTVRRGHNGTLLLEQGGDLSVIVQLDRCAAFAVADIYDWEHDERAIVLIGLDTLPEDEQSMPTLAQMCDKAA